MRLQPAQIVRRQIQPEQIAQAAIAGIEILSRAIGRDVIGDRCERALRRSAMVGLEARPWRVSRRASLHQYRASRGSLLHGLPSLAGEPAERIFRSRKPRQYARKSGHQGSTEMPASPDLAALRIEDFAPHCETVFDMQTAAGVVPLKLVKVDHVGRQRTGGRGVLAAVFAPKGPVACRRRSIRSCIRRSARWRFSWYRSGRWPAATAIRRSSL